MSSIPIIYLNTTMLRASAKPNGIYIGNKNYFTDIMILTEDIFSEYRISANLALLIISAYKSQFKVKDLLKLELLPEDIYELELTKHKQTRTPSLSPKGLQQTLNPFLELKSISNLLQKYPFMYIEILGIKEGNLNTYTFKRIPYNYNQNCEIYLTKPHSINPLEEIKLLFVSPYTCSYTAFNIPYVLYKSMFQINRDKYSFFFSIEEELNSFIPVLRSNGYLGIEKSDLIISYLINLTTKRELQEEILSKHISLFSALIDGACMFDIESLNEHLNDLRKQYYSIKDTDWLLC